MAKCHLSVAKPWVLKQLHRGLNDFLMKVLRCKRHDMAVGEVERDALLLEYSANGLLKAGHVDRRSGSGKPWSVRPVLTSACVLITDG
jgi:hypothetical protein